MRKKVGNEDPTLRERQEIMHRKAAALAWFKHGRKGSAVLGNGREGKMQNPLLHAPRARRHQANGASEGIGHHTYSTSRMRGNDPGEGIRHHGYDASSMGSDGASEYTGAYDKEGIPTMHMSATLVPHFVETPYHNLSMHQVNLSPMHQPSRFKAEALALKNPSSSSSSTDTDTTYGQFLALLSLLPRHQSQNCFNLSKKGCNASSSNSDIIDAIAASPWDCGSSLYDSFELLCLSNQLDHYLATTNATLAASSSLGSSSSYSKIIKNLASSPFHGPSLQPSYIPRSPYSLPQFMIPNYLAPKCSKKRSSLIHPIFSIPHGCKSTPSLPPLPAFSSPLHSQGKKSPSAAEDHVTRKNTESGGFRRAFNSLLKSLHIREDPAHQKPKRSNLSEELEKLPKNSRAPLRYEDPITLNRSPNSYSSSCRAEMGSQKFTSSSSPSSAAAMGTRRRSPNSSSAAASRRAASASSASTYHHFRNEGFRTTSKPPKSTKWLQPGAS